MDMENDAYFWSGCDVWLLMTQTHSVFYAVHSTQVLFKRHLLNGSMSMIRSVKAEIS